MGLPGPLTEPTGEGIGATHEVCAVIAPTYAAGRPPIRTFVEPCATIPGPAGTQPGSMHGVVIEVIVAAGFPPIRTFGLPWMMVSGRPG